VSARTDVLAARRQHLVAHSAQLRAVLGVDATALALRFGLVDRVMALARSGPARALVIGGAALVLFGRPRMLFRSAGRLLVLWPILKPFLPKLADLWRER
jgi:hypothetical protein